MPHPQRKLPIFLQIPHFSHANKPICLSRLETGSIINIRATGCSPAALKKGRVERRKSPPGKTNIICGSGFVLRLPKSRGGFSRHSPMKKCGYPVVCENQTHSVWSSCTGGPRPCKRRANGIIVTAARAAVAAGVDGLFHRKRMTIRESALRWSQRASARATPCHSAHQCESEFQSRCALEHVVEPRSLFM